MIDSSMEAGNGRSKVHRPFIRYGYFSLQSQKSPRQAGLDDDTKPNPRPRIHKFVIARFRCFRQSYAHFLYEEMPSMEGKGTNTAEGSILKDKERHGHEGTTCLWKEVALDVHLGRPFSSL